MAIGANDLTTLAEVKQVLRIAQNNDDDLIQNLITQVSDFIEDYIDRTFAIATYTEVLNENSYGSRIIIPLHTPIVSVNSVSILGTPLSYNATVDSRSMGYSFDKKLIYLHGFAVPHFFGGLTVSYTAGYAEIPPAIRLACNQLVGLRYKEYSRLGESSKALQGATVNYLTDAMPKAVEATLNSWRRVI
jgi:uncharacterized phiE125 gp8 family phage protein